MITTMNSLGTKHEGEKSLQMSSTDTITVNLFQ